MTFDRLLHPDKEPQNWTSYSGSLFNQRFSPLTQITPANVKNLDLQWVWQSKSLEKFEATALVVDGVLYTLQGPPVQGVYEVVALDAVTGRPFWTLVQPQILARPCCGRVSRGPAILGVRLHGYDRRAPGRDRRERRKLSGTSPRRSWAEGNREIRHHPRLSSSRTDHRRHGRRRLGVRGDLRVRSKDGGALALRSPAGRARQRDVVGRSWETGGAGVNSGVDAERDLVYFGRGAPDWDGRERLGDKLYSDSVVALDADTGKLRWHYQFTPHDEVDYDSTQVPVLADIPWQGKLRKVMLWANRNGLAYVIDRTTGEFLLGKPYVKVNWMDGFDPKGRPLAFPDSSDAARHADHADGANNRRRRLPAHGLFT